MKETSKKKENTFEMNKKENVWNEAIAVFREKFCSCKHLH